MKVKIPSLIITVVLSVLLGAVCYLLAPESNHRQWISFGVGFITILSALIPATSLEYDRERRGVSIKVLAWTGFVASVATNMIFSLFEYKIENYIIVSVLVAAVADALDYAIYKSK